MASTEPIYSPFFGVMGAASAIIFSGEFLNRKFHEKEKAKWKNLQFFITRRFAHKNKN
jgi:hypothetical protein